jgi:flagellar motor switch protein FliG
MADSPGEIAGAERAAILLMSLGEQEAAAVIRHLDARAVQRVGLAMAGMKNLPRDRIHAVLGDFVSLVENRGPAGAGSPEFVKRVLTTSLGQQRAGMLMERIGAAGESGAGIEQLRWMEPRQIRQLLGEEHPQVVATVLAQLDPEQAGQVAGLLPEPLRTDVIRRIATLDDLPAAAIAELDALVGARAAASEAPATTRRLGGPRLAAGILNGMVRELRTETMDLLVQADSELGQKIKELMFVFDDLMQVDDRGMQALLREVPSDQLGVALRGADPGMQEKVFRNMSKRAAEILKDDMEVRGPVKLSEVEAAQKVIVTTAQRLADEGSLVLGGSSADYV